LTDRLSLRMRLLLGVFVLAGLGLAGADLATYTSLRSYLLDRVDDALQAGHVQVEQTELGSTTRVTPLHAADGEGESDEPESGVGPPAAGIDWFQVRTRSGRVVKGGFLVGGGSAPKLDAEIPIPARATRGDERERVTYLTVASVDGSTPYRVRVAIEQQHPNRILVIATSLHGLNETLHRLVLIELLATLAALGAIAGVGLWVVRLGLGPLRQIESTAAAIAAGDLSQRVERAEPKTEVGRLGLSLNAMLAQIESAFAAREQSEKRLRRFVADASHELRTPLAAVRAYAELFGRGAAQRPADLARSMQGITREAERMSLLVEDLLLLARLDEGRPLEQKPVDLAALVGEAIDAARILDSERPIELSVEPVTVLGDHDRLRQAVDNLFANVRSHTPPRTRVEVGLHRVDGRVELSVSDTGPGLSEEEASKIFERFFRVDSSRTRASGGVGLGLSIVAAVAHAHAGTVEVRPAPGGGARFVISIPDATDAAA